jgi:hypothetical protein
MEHSPFNTHPTSWKEFADWFPGTFGFVDLEDAPAECHWAPIPDWTHLTNDLQRAEEPFREELDEAIRKFAKSGTLTIHSEGAMYFLGLRADTACRFTLQLCVKRGEEWADLIPYPSGETFVSLSSKLLIDWWHKSGYWSACESRAFEDFMPRD